MNKTLGELVVQSAEISRALVESDGELTNQLEDLLKDFETGLTHKIDGYSFIEDQLEVQAAFFKKKAEVYTRIAKAHERAQERLRDRLKQAMQCMERPEIQGDEIIYKLVKGNPSLQIEIKDLPQEYLLQIVHTEANKVRIKEDLKQGIKIPGVEQKPSVCLRKVINRKGESA